MSDVRLTATNPEDSTVVPVACNERGELLVTKTVIDEINNDVTVNGLLRVEPPDDARGQPASFLPIKAANGWTVGQIYSPGGAQLYITSGGYRTELDTFTRTDARDTGGACDIRLSTNVGRITFHAESDLKTGDSSDLSERFRIDVAGGHSQNLFLHPEGLERASGPVIDVANELAFLRDQVRIVLEKLRMTPEAGWGVWDGSSED